MLTVAPKGKTKFLTSLRMPARSAHSRVTGKVAELELVEKAVKSAGAKWRR
jgi:hypothetical protein